MSDTKHIIIWSVIATGISSIAVQLVTIREFLTQFQGNEITISLVLFCWLLITGLGSFVAKIFQVKSDVVYGILILIIALWPIPQIALIRYCRESIFIHGVSQGFYQILFYILITTFIYCFLVGFVLPSALEVLRRNYSHFSSGHLYITDNIGDILGGIVFSFFLVYWMKPFKTIAVTSSLLILTSLPLLIVHKRKNLLLISLLFVCLFYFFALNQGLETSLLSNQYGTIEKYIESPYGRIVVTKEGPQYTFWESGLPIYSNGDIINSEEKVHYALSQLDSVGNVLLISGGFGETLEEILKYRPEHIYYIELDPYFTGVADDLGFLKDSPFLTVINDDARNFLKGTEKKYDAIIIDLPDPDTFQLNRFFTSEFFSLSKRVLDSGGVMSFGMEYSPNYISEIGKQKLSTVYNTALLHFDNIRILPGEEAYYLCRDEEISTDIPGQLRKKNIPTKYIDGFYYGNVTEERIEMIERSIDRQEYVNTDLSPRMMNIVFKEWFFRHDTSPNAFFLILLGVMCIYLLFLRKEEYVLFSTGLATMGIEMLIIFAFQIIYGYIYLKIGVIVTVFLIGLLPGAFMGNMGRERNYNGIIMSELVLLSLLIIFFVWGSFVKGEPGQVCFLVYGFLFSFFCGFQFPVITRIIGEKDSPAAGCLAADLAGAALGTFVVGAILVPLLGIQAAIVFLILIKTTSSLLIFFT